MKYKFLGNPDNRFPKLKTGEVYDLEVTVMDDLPVRPLILIPFRCPYSSWETFYNNWKPVDTKPESDKQPLIDDWGREIKGKSQSPSYTGHITDKHSTSPSCEPELDKECKCALINERHTHPKPESDKESVGSRKGLRKFWRLGEYNPKLRVVGGEGGGKADGKGSTECGGFVLSESDKVDKNDWRCECKCSLGHPNDKECPCHPQPESDKQPLIDDWGREVKKGKSNKDIFEAMEQGSKEKLFKPKESVYVSDIPKGTTSGNFKISGDGTGESDKEKCDHDHLCCPGDIKTVRCAYCGKSMYHEPQEELEVEPLKKTYFYSNEPMTDREEFVARGQEKHHDKIQELIKAHNALVKEVKRQNSEPTNVIKPHEAYCRKCLLWKEINKDGYCFNCLLTLSK